MKTPFFIALLFAVSLPALAQDIQDNPVNAECSAILAKPFDGGLDPNVQPDCDSPAYYYGIGRSKDFAAARACAFIERFRKVNKDGSLFTGSGILSMVFANGEGTERNIDLARHFTCEITEASPSETDARLRLLDKMAAAPKEGRHFDLCSTATSGQSATWCESIQLRIHDARRYDDLVKMVDALTPAQQEAFKVLQTAEQEWEAQRAEKEVDQTGTIRGALVQQEQDRVRAQFAGDFKLFAKPDFTEPSFSLADSKMNEEYALVRKDGPRNFRNTTITVAGVEEAQAVWIKYREAWRKYVSVVNPTVSSDAVATQITRERLTQLHKLATMF
jgi:uncharacterized protein YecT (DUF1311 family)